MEIKTAAIVGAGALGVVWGQYCLPVLGRENLVFLADADRVSRYQKEGIYCNGKLCDFRYSAGEGEKAVDLVIIAVKAGGLRDAMDHAAHVVGESTTLLSLLNGVTSEEELSARFGPEKVIYSVAQGMDALRVGNQVTYSMPGELRMGIVKDTPALRERLRALDDLLNKTGYKHTMEEDILHRLWGKLMMNVGVNQVCTVFETDYGGVQRPGEARDILIAAMEEVRAVAAARGITLTEQDRDGYLALMDSLTPESMPSMRQDGLAGRKTEVDIFAGTILRYGEALGLATPVNRWIYDKVTEIEWGFEQAQKG